MSAANSAEVAVTDTATDPIAPFIAADVLVLDLRRAGTMEFVVREFGEKEAARFRRVGQELAVVVATRDGLTTITALLPVSHLRAYLDTTLNFTSSVGGFHFCGDVEESERVVILEAIQSAHLRLMPGATA